MTRFQDSLDQVLRYEGGYVDHPNDPGGATNMGITRKTLARWRRISPWWKLSKREVRTLKRAEAARIYRALYWDRCRAGLLEPGLDFALFDFAVNSGPHRAVQQLQKLVGTLTDGIMGPLTLSAVRLFTKNSKSGLADLIRALCAARLGFLRRLSSFSKFGRGWRARVDSVQAYALLSAGLANETDTLLKTQPRKTLMNLLSGYKTYIVAIAMLLAGLGQVLGIDLPGFNDQSAGQLIVEALAILFLRRGIKNEISNA